MAKMFYNLQEVAEKLGISEEKVRELGANGKLQVFRDRDKVMFKRDKVDDLALSDEFAAKSDSVSDMTGSGTGISLQTSGSASATGSGFDLADSGVIDAKADSGQDSGINIFDADEVDSADPMAQTQVTQASDDEDLALESVGSGSGLLDLTRESDDSSLGAELIEEIQLSDTASDSKVGSLPGASGSFETGLEMEASASGLENLQTAGEPGGMVPVMIAEPFDPTWSGLSAGMLIGASASLVVTLIVAIYGVAGVGSTLTRSVAESASPTGRVLLYAGGLLLLSIVFGVVGMFVGKMRDR